MDFEIQCCCLHCCCGYGHWPGFTPSLTNTELRHRWMDPEIPCVERPLPKRGKYICLLITFILTFVCLAVSTYLALRALTYSGLKNIKPGDWLNGTVVGWLILTKNGPGTTACTKRPPNSERRDLLEDCHLHNCTSHHLCCLGFRRLFSLANGQLRHC